MQNVNGLRIHSSIFNSPNGITQLYFSSAKEVSLENVKFKPMVEMRAS